MPKQEGTPPFDEDELLYRRLPEHWIGENDTVKSAAIEFPRTSVERQLFATPEQTLARASGGEVAVAAVRFGALPVRIDPQVANINPVHPPKSFEIVVAYAPEEGQAHAHIESRQVGASEAREPKGAMKAQIRDQIAAVMRVVLRRTP